MTLKNLKFMSAFINSKKINKIRFVFLILVTIGIFVSGGVYAYKVYLIENIDNTENYDDIKNEKITGFSVFYDQVKDKNYIIFTYDKCSKNFETNKNKTFAENVADIKRDNIKDEKITGASIFYDKVTNKDYIIFTYKKCGKYFEINKNNSLAETTKLLENLSRIYIGRTINDLNPPIGVEE